MACDVKSMLPVVTGVLTAVDQALETRLHPPTHVSSYGSSPHPSHIRHCVTSVRDTREPQVTAGASAVAETRRETAGQEPRQVKTGGGEREKRVLLSFPHGFLAGSCLDVSLLCVSLTLRLGQFASLLETHPSQAFSRGAALTKYPT